MARRRPLAKLGQFSAKKRLLILVMALLILGLAGFVAYRSLPVQFESHNQKFKVAYPRGWKASDKNQKQALIVSFSFDSPDFHPPEKFMSFQVNVIKDKIDPKQLGETIDTKSLCNLPTYWLQVPAAGGVKRPLIVIDAYDFNGYTYSLLYQTAGENGHYDKDFDRFVQSFRCLK